MIDATTRNTHLRDILSGRRLELQQDVRRRIRNGRTDRTNDVGDEIEHSDANITGDVEFALLQIQDETLRRVDEALRRLEVNGYGSCFECGVEISETRLRALPFAVRCKACEEKREHGRARTGRLTRQHASSTLFPEVVSP